MLRLIKTDKPSINQLQRLWFSDLEHDLFIWLNQDNHPVSFQFSYNKSQNEHIFNWHQQTGYSHDKVDDGEHEITRYKMTPVMIPDWEIDIEKISRIFKLISTEIQPELAEFIETTIKHASSDR